MAISTNGTVLTRLAGALYNTQMSNATYAEVAALDPATLANTLYARDFSTSTDLAVATTLVTNLGLSTVAGLSNWVAAQLTAAGSAKGAKVVDLLNGFAQMSADATYGAAATAFNTKVDAALALSQTTGNAGGTFAAAGTAAAVFTLVTGIDDIAGTSADETFNAIQTGDSDETFSAYDAIAGGAGTDTLNITNTEAAVLNLANVSGIENIVYRSTGGGGTIDMDKFTGETSLTMDRTVGTQDVSNFGIATALTVTNSTATMDSTVTYKSTLVTGTADAGSVTLNGVTAGADLEFSGAVESFAVTTTGAASAFADLVLPSTVTELSIDAGVALTVATTFTAAAVEELTITGAGAVSITPALADTVEVVDASAATGIVTLKMGNADQVITGGTANDVIDMDAYLDKNDSIDLGEGTDTLRIDVDGLSAGVFDLDISNVEVFRFDNTGSNNGAINMDNLTPTRIRFDGVNGASQTATTGVVTLTDVTTAVTNFELIGVGSGTGGAPSDNVAFNGLTVDYDVSGATNVAEATISINNGGVTGDDFFVQKITIDNTESIVISAADVGAAAADELTITEIEGNDVEVVTIISNQEVIVNDIDGDVLETVDLSGVAAGGAAVTISDHAASLTIYGSDGNDTVTMTDNTSSSEVEVDLGAGNDTYVSVDATDTITTGAGSDTVAFQGDENDDANVITDFTVGAGGDIVDIVSSAVALDSGNVSDFEKDTSQATGANLTAVDGLLAIDFAEVADLATGTVLSFIQDFYGTGGTAELVFGDSADNIYLLVDDGTDTGLYLLDAGATDSSGTTVTLIATFQGVEVAGFTAANFADFI